MEIKPQPGDQRPWKVLGEFEGARISVAPPTSIKIEAGGVTAVLPLVLVAALQTAEAIAFMRDPGVVPFMYAANDRESRLRAAQILADRSLSLQRREFVQALMAQHGLKDSEAWSLAKIKYPAY